MNYSISRLSTVLFVLGMERIFRNLVPYINNKRYKNYWININEIPTNNNNINN